MAVLLGAESRLVVCFSLWLVGVYWQTVCSELFTSTSSLGILFEQEESIYPALEEYLLEEQSRIQKLKRLVAERRLNRQQEPTSGDPLDYVGHPLNAYHLVRQLHDISSLVTDRSNLDNLTRQLRHNRLPFPSEEDYSGAVGALVRLQQVYNLSIEDLYEGVVKGEPSIKPLSPGDAYSLGLSARKTGNYALSARWLEVAVQKIQQDETLQWQDAVLELAQTHYLIGDYPKALELIEELRQKVPNNSTVRTRHNVYQRQNDTMHSRRNGEMRYLTVDTWKQWLPSWKRSYEALCRRDQENMNPVSQSRLYCHYHRGFVPYSPAKEEILSLDPRVSMFYDVISDAEAERIKQLAMPALRRAVVGDPQKSEQSNERVSKVGWLWDHNQEELVAKLSKRVEFITGLSTEYRDRLASAEPFQVVNYGMGGQYEPHVDFYENETHLARVPRFIKNTGDRLTTFLFYLTQPKAGGATVFPKINVHVPPVKNAAAFWYNIQKNGFKDPRTQHAGCPVLLGEKWVANKWIREYGQEFRNPCGRNYDDLYT